MSPLAWETSSICDWQGGEIATLEDLCVLFSVPLTITDTRRRPNSKETPLIIFFGTYVYTMTCCASKSDKRMKQWMINGFIIWFIIKIHHTTIIFWMPEKMQMILEICSHCAQRILTYGRYSVHYNAVFQHNLFSLFRSIFGNLPLRKWTSNASLAFSTVRQLLADMNRYDISEKCGLYCDVLHITYHQRILWRHGQFFFLVTIQTQIIRLWIIL